MAYQPRNYRNLHKEEDLRHFQVMVGETDLDIGIKAGQYRPEIPEEVCRQVIVIRDILQSYINRDRIFLTTLEPYEPHSSDPAEILEMCRAASLAGVGPMAAVAGLFAQRIGQYLTRYSRDVIVENGGDIWLKTVRNRKVAIYAGDSPFSNRIALEIRPKDSPLGICTSSGTVGHSLSFGKADAAVILAPSAILADAVATATGNLVQGVEDLEQAVDFALSVPGVTGAIAILGDKLAVRGKIKLLPV